MLSSSPDSTPTPTQPSSQPQSQSQSQPQPPSPSPPPRRSISPPFADTVIRPFTSQGSTFSTPQLFNYPPPPPLSSNASAHAHAHAHDAQLDPPPPKSNFGPYTSASARTSYTRVEDSLTAPVYPQLPSLPGASSEPARVGDNEPAPIPTTTTTTTTAMTDGYQNNVATAPADPPIPQTPQVSLTFLLVSGCRKTQSFDPETTVGRMKELVWSAWPVRDADWQDERPPAPSYLRILYLGKILQDDETLLRIGFPTSLPSSPTPTQTIVHLSIRPYAPPSDDPALNKKRKLSVAIGRRASATATATATTGGEGDVAQEGESAGCCTGCVVC